MTFRSANNFVVHEDWSINKNEEVILVGLNSIGIAFAVHEKSTKYSRGSYSKSLLFRSDCFEYLEMRFGVGSACQKKVALWQGVSSFFVEDTFLTLFVT